MIRTTFLRAASSLCLCFCLSPARAAERPLDATQWALDLPAAIAHVTDVHWALGRQYPDFILIQDVHKHPEVQSHICAIILHAYHSWGARKVFLEGAFSNVDVSVFENVTGPARPLLLRRLLQQGDLSGPELAAIFIDHEPRDGGSPFQLIGMEDPAVYRENLQAYEQVQEEQDAALMAFHGLSGEGLRPDQLDRLLLLVQLKMTPADYAAYWHEKAIYARLPRINHFTRAAERFYELVHIRSHIFLDRASRAVPAWSGPRIVVVGGFHTAVMAEELRKQGRSFVVLTPTVTQSGFEPLYQKHLMDNVSALLPPKNGFSAKTN